MRCCSRVILMRIELHSIIYRIAIDDYVDPHHQGGSEYLGYHFICWSSARLLGRLILSSVWNP